MKQDDLLLERRTLLKLLGGTFMGSLLVGCDESSVTETGSGLTLLYNGIVLPVDDTFSEHEALVIKDGQVVELGSSRDMLEKYGSEASTVNLEGKTVLPGFIEPHMHFGLLSMTASWVNVSPTRYSTTDQVLEALSAATSDGDQDEWLMAAQFDPSLQEGPDMLTTRELDRVSRTRPIFVLNASGHLAYVNSRVLELMGIDAETENPPGGEYYRFDDGSPNGAMTQKAWLPVLLSNEKFLHDFSTGAVDAGIRVSDDAASKGITTLCDMATGGAGGASEIENYRAMFRTGAMNTRVRCYLYGSYEEVWRGTGIQFGEGDHNLKVSGLKVISDGSNQGYTGRQRDPYFNREDRGIFYMEPDELRSLVNARVGDGWSLAIHGNGDAAIDSILDACEAAKSNGMDIEGARIRIEHCSFLHDDQIARMAGLGVNPSFLINHVYFWGQAMRDHVVGPDKALLLDRCASAERAGLKWTMHSDAPVSQLGPLQLIRAAVARDLWKEPGNTLAPEEAVSVEAAIRAITINAAWQCFSEQEIGSLEAGKLADLVVLEKDPRSVAPNEIADIKVLETWLNGIPVFQSA